MHVVFDFNIHRRPVVFAWYEHHNPADVECSCKGAWHVADGTAGRPRRTDKFVLNRKVVWTGNQRWRISCDHQHSLDLQNILLLAAATLLTGMALRERNPDNHGSNNSKLWSGRGPTSTSGFDGTKAGDCLTRLDEDSTTEETAEHVLAVTGAAAQQVDRLRDKCPGYSSFRIACDAKHLTVLMSEDPRADGMMERPFWCPKWVRVHLELRVSLPLVLINYCKYDCL